MHNKKRILLGSIVCSLAALFYVYDYFIQVAPSVMVDDLMRDFHIGAGALGILSACFFYSYAFMQIPAGWMLDRWGARLLLSGAVLISAIGVILFAAAHALWVAGFGRFLIGLGSAFSFIGTLSLLSRWFSHQHFATFAGLVQLGACIGSIIGLAPIAVLVNRYGWRDTMHITGLATLGLAVLFWLVIRNSPQKNLHTQKRVSNTLPLKSLFKNKQVWVICACGFFSWVPVGGFGALWGVPYLMKAYQLTNTQAGELMMWMWLGIGVGSPLIGWVSYYFTMRKQPIVICFMLSLISLCILFEASLLSKAITVLALFGLGVSASSQSLTFGVLKDVVLPEQFGVASGLNNMGAILGGGLAQTLMGYMLTLTWNGAYQNGMPLYTLHNYQSGLMFIGVMAALGFFTALFFLRETHCRTHCSANAIF